MAISAELTERTPLLSALEPETPERRQPPRPIIQQLAWLFLVTILVGLNHGIQFIAPVYLNEYALCQRRGQCQVTLRAASILGSALACILTTPLWTALGDRFGRRPILLISMLATFLPNLALMAIKHHGLNHRSYLLGVLCGGLLGGFTTFIAVIHTYAADCISAERRFGLFSVLHGLVAVTLFAPDVFFSNESLFPSRDLDQFTSYVELASVALVIIAVLALFFMPESSSTRHSDLGLGLWIPSPPFRRSSFIGLALLFYSFTTAFHGTFGWKHSWHHHHTSREAPEDFAFLMKLTRYFVGIPLFISVRYGPSSFPPIRLDHSFATFSVLLHTFSSTGAAVVSTVIAQSSKSQDFFVALTMFLALTIFTVGAIPAIYSLAAGYYQETGKQAQWGLLLGRLSIMQTVSEAVVGALEEFFGDGLYGIYQLYFVAAVCQALAFTLLWQFPRGSGQRINEGS